MNKKIYEFNRDWHNYKQSSFGTILRTIVDVFYENINQYRDIFKEIMTYNNHNNNIPNDKSKKSINLDSSTISDQNVKNHHLKKDFNSNKINLIGENDNEKIDGDPDKSKIFLRKSTSFFYEIKKNYCQFNLHLKKTLNIIMEDEHLRDLEENEIAQIFKQVLNEMTRKFEDYKAQVGDCLKFYKEIKENYLEELIEGKDTYVNSLENLLYHKFNKFFSKKKGNYLEIFALVIEKLRGYIENIRNYLDVF